jgi:hypothetical protein
MIVYVGMFLVIFGVAGLLALAITGPVIPSDMDDHL